MRALIIIVLLVVVAFAIGWITMDRQEGSVNLRVNTEKVESDTNRVIEGAKDAVSTTEEAVTPNK